MLTASRPTTRAICERLIGEFPPETASNVERAIAAVYAAELGPVEAELLAEDQAENVLGMLGALPAAELPFTIAGSARNRLVGKNVSRPGDPASVSEIRARWSLIPDMRTAIFEMGPQRFEQLCAKLMTASGALGARALVTADEGGIDIYGRLPVRLHNPAVPTDLIETTFIRKDLLFFGQCKCYRVTAAIERGEMDKFHAQALSALDKYTENTHPPSHHVPYDFFVRNETCLRLFFTTADFSGPARTSARERDIVLIDGRQIAEHLVYLGVGISSYGGTSHVDISALQLWATGLS